MDFDEEPNGEWPESAKALLRDRIRAANRIDNPGLRLIADSLLDLWVSSPGSGLTVKDVEELLLRNQLQRSVSGIPKLVERLDGLLASICDDVCSGAGMKIFPAPYRLSVAGPAPYWWSERSQMTIGLLVANAADWFTGQLVKGVLKALPTDYSLLIDSSNDRDELQSARFKAMMGRCDGMLMVPIEDNMEESILRTLSLFPSVLVDRYLRDATAIPSVHHDDFIAGRFAAALLRSRNCKRVWVVQQQSQDRGSQSLTPMSDRVAGCRGGNSEKMRVEVIGARGADEAGGVAALESVKDRIRETDGVFATTDKLAIGCRHFLKALPEPQRPPLSNVISFEGQPFGAYIEPPLTSIFADPEILGTLATRVLLRRLSHPHDKCRSHYVVEPTLLSRGADISDAAFREFLDTFKSKRLAYYAKQSGGTQEQILLVQDASDSRLFIGNEDGTE